MTAAEFRLDLLNDVNARVASVGGFSESAFTEIAAEHLQDANEISTFQACTYWSPDSKTRIDGWFFDGADESLFLFVTQYDGSSELTSFGKAEAKNSFSKVQRFIEVCVTRRYLEMFDENHDARAIAEQYFDSDIAVSRIRIYLLTDSILTSRVKDWPEGNARGIPIEYHIWDISRFHRAFESATGGDDFEVDFRRSGSGLPCLEVSDPVAPYAGYLCVISAAALGEIYDEYGARLLEGNVRSFLTAKGKINQGIRKTLIERPAMFFAYNNGISAIASSVKIEEVGGRKTLQSAIGLQIVNGGQTTASVANVLRSEKASVLTQTFVPMKLAVVSGEQTSQMIEEISKYANSQNKVSDADFFSNHPFHRRLEQISRRLLSPVESGKQYETKWYYERARGQYLNEFARLTASQRDQLKLIIPKGQVVTKTDLARSELSWMMRPHVVCQGAQSFMREFAERIAPVWRADETLINEEYYRRNIARVIIFRTAEQLVSKQPWYYSGFRGFVVAYLLSRIAQELVELKAGEVDLKRIWRKQVIDDILSAEIVRVASLVFSRITNLPTDQKNASQWVKRQTCWEAVRAMPIHLGNEFLSSLVTFEEVKDGLREAKKAQAVDSSIDSQALVLALGARYWAAASLWARSNGSLSVADLNALKAASGSYGSVPTERQCSRLLQLRKMFESQGFVTVDDRDASGLNE